LDAPPLSSSLPRRRRMDKCSSRALHTAPLLPLCLCATRASLLYHRAEPSPPFLSHGAARVASMQCTAIKGGQPLRLIHTSAVSHHCLTRLCSLPLHRCKATSPHLSPHTHVPELSTTPVSSASPLSALLASIPHLGPCQAGALRSMDASRGHLPMGHPVADHHWQCHAMR
jgi:hypothetical protein